MECKDLTCREEEVLEGSRGEDRLVIKVVIKVVIKKAIVEDTSEAHRVTVAVVITTVMAPMELTRIIINSSPTKKEEGAKGGNLGLSGGRACIAWPNTGRLVVA